MGKENRILCDAKTAEKYGFPRVNNDLCVIKFDALLENAVYQSEVHHHKILHPRWEENAAIREELKESKPQKKKDVVGIAQAKFDEWLKNQNSAKK